MSIEKNAIREKIYNNCEDLINEIIYKKSYLFNSFPLLFRGEASSTYRLIPSVLRLTENQKKWFYPQGTIKNDPDCKYERFLIDAEYNQLRNFHRLANSKGMPVPRIKAFDEDLVFSKSLNKGDKWINEAYFELAGLAQHYGLPTRLIDWTDDPFVALYFAVSNTMRLMNDSKNITGDYMVLWVFNHSPMHFPKYTKIGSPIRIIQPPYLNNPNLAAQHGFFTLFELDVPNNYNDPVEELIKISSKGFDEQIASVLVSLGVDNYEESWVPVILKIAIPQTECYKLYNILSSMGYDASRIFPGFGSIVMKLEQDRLLYDENFFKR